MGATIKDIAARTGLGLATISKYLNGGHVLEKNQIAIEEAIEELDFQVNTLARSLKTKQSKTVGVVIPQLNNLFMTSMIAKLERTLRRYGYGIMVCDTSMQVKREVEVLQFLSNKMVDGIILLATGSEAPGLELIQKRGIPVVLVDRKLESAIGKLDMVLLDNYEAAYNSTRYLLEQGHDKIGILLGAKEIYTARERLSGYKAALEDAGIFPQESLIRHTDFSMQAGYRQTQDMLSEVKDLTAIFATNFEMSLGALLALKDQGYAIPDDVSLIGFDNRELARAMQLTIVSQPFEEMGYRAAKLLLNRMQAESQQQAQTVMLKASIEEGASVARKEND